MLTLSRNQIVLLMLAVSFTGAARGDELQYLPDKASIVVSVNLQDFLKSKVSTEFTKAYKLTNIDAKELDIEKMISQDLGMPVANISRITVALRMSKDEGGYVERDFTGMVTTLKKVTAADVIASKKASPSFRKNLIYKEHKIGKYIVYEENYQYEIFDGNDKQKKLSKVQFGEAFCVVEDRLVLFGQLHPYTPPDEKPRVGDLRRVLERDAAPTVSTGMKIAMKNAPLANSGAAILDLQSPAAAELAWWAFGRLDAFKELAGGLEAMTVTLNEKNRVTGRLTAYCKDEETAAKVKKHVDARFTEFHDRLRKDAEEELPKEEKDLLHAAKTVIGAIRTSVSGKQVTAEVSASPEIGARFLLGYMHIVSTKPAKK